MMIENGKLQNKSYAHKILNKSTSLINLKINKNNKTMINIFR